MHVLGAMLGVAMTLAFEDLFTKGEHPFEWAHAFAFGGFAITAIIFTVAMMTQLHDHKYWLCLGKHHALAAYDLFSDVATALILVFMAFKLRDAWLLLWSNVALRIVDVAIELLVMCTCGSEQPTNDRPRVATWMKVDLLALIFLAGALVGVWIWSWNLLVVSWIFLLQTVICTVIDLRGNGNFYFGGTDSQPG